MGQAFEPLIAISEGRCQMIQIGMLRRLVLGIGLSALASTALAGPAFGANTVVQAITGNGLTASVADLTLASVAYQNAAHNVNGTMTLTADDSTGSGAGWNVTIQASAFGWVGTANGGTDIPASDFALTSAAAPTMIAGQPVDAALSTGPQVPPTSPLGTLDTPRKILVATAAYGAGTYSQVLGVSLTIPGQSRVGVYTSTLTTTITSAP
jgi:WxL domain surface cell wall-binding